MKFIISSVSSFMFALLIMVMLSVPTNASAMAVGASCLACSNTAEMPPGAVSALAGTKIMKVASTTGSNNSINSSAYGSINLMLKGDGVPGDDISTDALVAVSENLSNLHAFNQNLILDYSWRF